MIRCNIKVSQLVGMIALMGAMRCMAGHSACPTVCDFDGDGIPDLVIGAEDGYFYHLANPRSR